MEEKKIYKNLFTIRKDGENGEKKFVTLGNVVMSTKLHDTEEEAIKELEEINLESIAKMLIAVLNYVTEYTDNNFIKKEENNESKHR